MQTPIQQNVVPLARTSRRPPSGLPPAPPPANVNPLLVPFPRWQKACDRVSAALLGGETRVVVSGPPGTGKTLLLDNVARVLRAAGWTVVLRLADAAPAPGQSGNVALLVDEADRLSRDAMHRLLAATPGPLLLAGLDVLQSRVAGATLIALGALGREEARDFIAQWLMLAGRSPDHLEAAAMRRTIEISGGVPRLIATLLGAAAWLADSADAPVIIVHHVEEAAALRSCFIPDESEAEEPDLLAEPERRINTPALVATAAAMLLLGAGAYVAASRYPSETGRALTMFRETVATLRDRVTGAVPAQLASAAAPTSAAAKSTPPMQPPPVAAPAPVAASTEAAAPTPMPLAAPPTSTPATVATAPTLVAAPAAPEITLLAAVDPPAQRGSEPETMPPPPPIPPSESSDQPAPSEPPTALAEAPAAAPAPEPPPPAPIVIASARPLVPPRSLPAETVSLLLHRGTEMMELGDVSAARLLFGRAAEAGNADAMIELGRTFDPTILARTSPLSAADPAEAARWYRRAAALGSPAAADLLRQLTPEPAR